MRGKKLVGEIRRAVKSTDMDAAIITPANLIPDVIGAV
jgi:hypothetical protein